MLTQLAETLTHGFLLMVVSLGVLLLTVVLLIAPLVLSGLWKPQHEGDYVLLYGSLGLWVVLKIIVIAYVVGSVV